MVKLNHWAWSQVEHVTPYRSCVCACICVCVKRLELSIRAIMQLLRLKVVEFERSLGIDELKEVSSIKRKVSA